ncbi:MAG: RHS repeat-associated core domain-containing protein, partial [Candidatus Rokubacteria bacterium]|nr:RHS repeat-associated core domain-containing protein [Candidatus Rokubacteria bacterium]
AARETGAGTVSWYGTDREGSVRLNLSATGALLNRNAYDAYGQRTSQTSPSNGDRFAYTGAELQSDLGAQLHDLRWYDPRTGRWTSEDPLGFGAGDYNVNRYVGNGPTNATDSSGLFEATLTTVSLSTLLAQQIEGNPGRPEQPNPGVPKPGALFLAEEEKPPLLAQNAGLPREEAKVRAGAGTEEYRITIGVVEYVRRKNGTWYRLVPYGTQGGKFIQEVKKDVAETIVDAYLKDHPLPRARDSAKKGSPQEQLQKKPIPGQRRREDLVPDITPENPLGPGDLVVLSKNRAVTVLTGDDVWEDWAKKKGFTLVKEISSEAEFRDALDEARKKRGGRPFRRIIVISHTGGHTDDGPGIEFAKGKQITSKNLHWKTIVAVLQALEREGAFVIGTCGYYEDKDVEAERWLQGLQKWATKLDRQVFADQVTSHPDAEGGGGSRLDPFKCAPINEADPTRTRPKRASAPSVADPEAVRRGEIVYRRARALPAGIPGEVDDGIHRRSRD